MNCGHRFHRQLTDNHYMRVMVCIIDEAHLEYDWGSEFRPDFGKLSQLSPILTQTATAPKKLIEFLTGNLQIKDPFILVGNLDRPNIFICKSKWRPSSFGAESYNNILLPIAKKIKLKLIDYPLTIVYLPLKWCGYAFILFLDVLGKKSYFPENCVRSPGNCLLTQYHAP